MAGAGTGAVAESCAAGAAAEADPLAYVWQCTAKQGNASKLLAPLCCPRLLGCWLVGRVESKRHDPELGAAVLCVSQQLQGDSRRPRFCRARSKQRRG